MPLALKPFSIARYVKPSEQRSDDCESGRDEYKPKRPFREIEFVAVFPRNISLGGNAVPNNRCRNEENYSPDAHVQEGKRPANSPIVPV